MKTCAKCGEAKAFSMFGRDASQPDAMNRQCKACVNARLAKHRASNGERRREICAKYRQGNREQVRESYRRWYESPGAAEKKRVYEAANRDASRERKKRWREKNPLQYAIYKTRVRKATPPWADVRAIQAFYAEARRLTRETGIPHEVDHVIPLQGAAVSGLHVHTNLRVVTRMENRMKSNRMRA